MAINVSIYGNTNNITRSISIDFVAELFAESLTQTSNELEYYFKFTTSARDSNNIKLSQKISNSLSDLALINASNVAAQRYQSKQDSTDDYSDITEMISDYIYDYVEGHDANQWGSGCAEQKPMGL